MALATFKTGLPPAYVTYFLRRNAGLSYLTQKAKSTPTFARRLLLRLPLKGYV